MHETPTAQDAQDAQATPAIPKTALCNWPLLAVPLAVGATFLARFAEGRRLDHDVFHALCLWRETMARGRVPMEDVWAYTDTVPTVVHHEWLTGALNYGLAIVTGWGAEGLLAWKAACSLGAVLCACKIARLRGAPIIFVAGCSVLTMMFSMVSVGTGRAQVTTVFLFSLLLLLLEIDRNGNRKWIPLWLVIFPVWLNLHGGVVAGCGALAIHTLEVTLRARFTSKSWRSAIAQSWHLWLTGMVLFPLFLINPYGVKYVTYLVAALSMDRSQISEWWPLFSTVSRFRISVFLIMVGATIYSLRHRGFKQCPGILLLCVLTYFAFRQTRQVCFFSLAWLAYTPAALAATPFGEQVQELWTKKKNLMGTVAIAWTLMMLLQLRILGLPWNPKIPTTNTGGPSYYPTGLVSYLEQQGFDGDVITSFETGAWLSWKLYPHVKVSFDSRYEATYPSHVFEDTICFYGAKPGWHAALHRLEGDAILIPECYEIAKVWALNPPSGWRTVYLDDAQRFVVRTDYARKLKHVDHRGRRLSKSVF